jgi:hypothetical protein
MGNYLPGGRQVPRNLMHNKKMKDSIEIPRQLAARSFILMKIIIVLCCQIAALSIVELEKYRSFKTIKPSVKNKL